MKRTALGILAALSIMATGCGTKQKVNMDNYPIIPGEPQEFAGMLLPSREVGYIESMPEGYFEDACWRLLKSVNWEEETRFWL